MRASRSLLTIKIMRRGAQLAFDQLVGLMLPPAGAQCAESLAVQALLEGDSVNFDVHSAHRFRTAPAEANSGPLGGHLSIQSVGTYSASLCWAGLGAAGAADMGVSPVWCLMV